MYTCLSHVCHCRQSKARITASFKFMVAFLNRIQYTIFWLNTNTSNQQYTTSSYNNLLSQQILIINLYLYNKPLLIYKSTKPHNTLNYCHFTFKPIYNLIFLFKILKSSKYNICNYIRFTLNNTSLYQPLRIIIKQ